MSKTVLELKHIKKNFKQGREELEVLKDVSFTLKAKEMVALIGESGTGKSTLLQIVGLLDEATHGEVIIAGTRTQEISDLRRTLLRRQMLGFVYQLHHLLPEFTALENVMMPMLVNHHSKNSARNAALKILDRLGLKNRINHHPAALSGGEQQRVAIARAVVHKPKILLADEPTGNLDPKTSDQVFALLVELIEEYKLSAFVVTHNHTLANQMDSKVTLVQGKLKKQS